MRVGGTLVGAFGDDDLAGRDLILVALAEEATMHLGRLCEAFELSRTTLAEVRKRHEDGGLEALVVRGKRGASRRLDERACAQLHALFDDGLSIDDAHARMSTRRRGVSRATIGRERVRWAIARANAAAKVVAKVSEAARELDRVVPAQLELCAPSDVAATMVTSVVTRASAVIEIEPTIAPQLRSASHVQHLGSWILIAMVARLGLFKSARKATKDRVDAHRVRLAIEATIIALAIGEPTIEGVRRLASSTAPTLLRAPRCPSPEWVRHTFRKVAEDAGATQLCWRMVCGYLASERTSADRPAIFYVDNHLRPYTGKHTLRRGWRMQDKRVVAGASDYYVHDESGSPLWRETVADHAPLTEKLRSLAAHLRLGFGDQEGEDEQRVLLAFDRAGAFPGAISELRDAEVEFVTYERRPYPTLVKTAFTETTMIDGDEIRYCESRTNLGHGRGRVRRISFLSDDDRQINLLASSTLPAAELIAIQRHRWRQENGFKHGVERWGINQLDARKTEPYAPDTIVPNPARRRLDRSIRLLAALEGKLRCALADTKDAAARSEIRTKISEVSEHRDALLAQRPEMPKRAPLAETDLAGNLVKHVGEYKLLVDTIRIACANAESDLAAMLAPELPKPAEAKKLLAAVFAAPGNVRVGVRHVAIELDVAATEEERAALAVLANRLGELCLGLDGEVGGRRLRFGFTAM